MVLKEWECPVHGDFEGTHPVCPEIGCEAEIKQVFRTPVTIGSQTLKRFQAGIKQSVDMMGLGNLRSARAGEAAYGGNKNGMFWTNEVEKLGVNIPGLVASAGTPMKVTYPDGHQESINKSVMRELGAEGMTQRVLPKPAELTGHRQDRVRPKS